MSDVGVVVGSGTPFPARDSHPVTPPIREGGGVPLLNDLASYLTAPWRKLDRLHADLVRHELAIIQLRRDLMASVEDFASRIDAATTEVARDLQSVRDELAAVRDGLDAEVQTRLDAALSRLDAPIARLESLGQDPTDPDPQPEPSVDGATPGA